MNFNNGYPSYSSPYAYGTPYGRPYAPNYLSQPQPTPAQPYAPQPQPQPQPNYEMPIQNILFATSEEAKAYIVMPNTKVLLIDKANGVAHLKFADNMGQSQTQLYRFEPIGADGKPINNVEISFENYVSKKELEEMGFAKADDVKALHDKIDNLQRQIGARNGKPTT